MSYKSNLQGLRISYMFSWPSLFLSNNNFKKSLYGFSLYKNIERYLDNLLQERITEETLYNTNDTAITRGNHSIISHLGGLIIYLNYYFDLKLATKKQINSLSLKFYYANLFLKNLLNIRVTIISENFYLFMWKNELYNSCTDSESLKAISLAKEHNPHYYMMESGFFELIKGKYDSFIKAFGHNSKKNRYFIRIVQPLFILFHHRTLDCKIIAGVIAKELGLLRKGHKQFLRIIKDIFSYLFTQYKNKLEGLRLTIKGRLTLQNRQTRRKQKRIIAFGIIHNSKRRIHALQNSSLAYNRFGLINITFAYSFIKNELIQNRKGLNMKLSSLLFKKLNFKLKNTMELFDHEIKFPSKELFLTFIVFIRFLRNRMYINKLLTQKLPFTGTRFLNEDSNTRSIYFFRRMMLHLFIHAVN